MMIEENDAAELLRQAQLREDEERRKNSTSQKLIEIQKQETIKETKTGFLAAIEMKVETKKSNLFVKQKTMIKEKTALAFGSAKGI